MDKDQGIQYNIGLVKDMDIDVWSVNICNAKLVKFHQPLVLFLSPDALES